MSKLNKSRLLIAFCLCVTGISIAVSVYFAFFYKPKDSLIPDYAEIEEDSNLTEIPDDNNNKLEKKEGGGASSVIYKTEMTLSLDEGIIHLFYQNPSKSNESVVLQLSIQEHIIAKSGLIPPGNELNELAFSNTGTELQPGVYDAVLVVNFYNTETNEKAIVNSTMATKLIVE